ncbi:hypothetical protein C8R43DRAFT_960363 [Mycena crocata]|nr:hypothetical protein C8R43DRAFT_960363 [Mycena crocata]
MSQSAVVLHGGDDRRRAVWDERENGGLVMQGAERIIVVGRKPTGRLLVAKLEPPSTISVEVPPISAGVESFRVGGHGGQGKKSNVTGLPQATAPLAFAACAPPIFGTFAVSEAAPANSTPQAHAQARYRAKNSEAEQEKARRRMRRLRDNRKQQLRQRESSERLRATPLFARYREHVKLHFKPLYGDRGDPEFMAAWDAYRFGGTPHTREDALFCLKYGTPGAARPPTEAEIERQIFFCLRLTQMNECGLVLDWDSTDDEAAAGYARLEEKVMNYDDDDIEFMMRHAKPPPTFESLSRCTCNAGE